MHANSNPLLRLNSVSKVYRSGPTAVHALRDVSLEIAAGQSLAIVGPSGSGKTTLLGLCAGLDTPTTGEIWLDDAPLHSLDEPARARVRLQSVGFIFQSFYLIPSLNALENVLVPLELQGVTNARPRAKELLSRVGLAERLEHFPSQLSGGEQQRVAIARAFVTSPKVLFADEPTGNLDVDTALEIRRMMFELNSALGTTLIIVTHDESLAVQTSRLIRLRGGAIAEDRNLAVAASQRGEVRDS